MDRITSSFPYVSRFEKIPIISPLQQQRLSGGELVGGAEEDDDIIGLQLKISWRVVITLLSPFHRSDFNIKTRLI